MALSDRLGLAVSTSSSEALTAYEQGIDLALRWRSGAMDALNTAVASDPHFTLAHCTKAYVGLRMGQVDTALEAHKQALARQDSVQTEREHLHVQTIDALARNDRATAHTYLDQIVAQHPTDRIALWQLNQMQIAQGNYRGGLALARRTLEACPDEPLFQTMTGFFLEQSGYNEDGLTLSLRSLATDPTNLYTYHAVGHAYQSRGDYRKALSTFERAASLERYPHILWHLAEMHAILGYERFTRDYWASTSPALPLFERIALLWRLEIIRHAPVDAAVWQDLATQGERLLQQADYLTIWMHHWIGLALARAGRSDKAQQRLAFLRGLPEGPASGYWSTLGADLLDGEMALMRADYPTAARLMAPAVQRIGDMGGGSREQKDIFLDIFLELQRRLGHADQVIALAQHRLLGNPCHLQSLAALAWAYQQTGQTALQRQVCHQFVRRAEEVQAAPDTPALQEARRILHAGA
jgi:tetratricopeptide (TPR) repeat protein